MTQLDELAADRKVLRYDPTAFEDWYMDLIEKTGMRIDKMAAHHLWERGFGIMDALTKIVGR